MAKSKKSPYEVLGVAKDADAVTIKREYRKRARKAHPDAGGSDEEMSEVNRAYSILGDPSRRLLYDQTGQDKPGVSIEDEAKAVLMSVFNQVIQNDNTTDCLKAAKGMVAGYKQNFETERKVVITKQQRLISRRAEISVKAGDNLFHQLIDSEIQRLEHGLIELKRRIEVCKVADKMLKQYESNVTEVPMTTFTVTMRFG